MASRGQERLRVLFATPYLPSPPRFGGQRRLHGLISGLAASHDVSVLSLVDPGEDHAEARRATEQYCRRVVTVPSRRHAAGGIEKRLWQLGSLLSSQSYEWLVHRDPAFTEALDRLLASERYDVVQLEFSHMAAHRAGRRRRGSGPVFLLDEHNIEYEIVQRTALAGSSPTRRLYCSADWPKVRAEERAAWMHLDGCTLTSARDQVMLLAQSPETRTAVVPNGVDLDFFQPGTGPEPGATRTVLFFGAIDYYPNTDGLLFFLDEVWPKLQAQSPGIRLRIVGRQPPESIVRRRSPDVEITGAVDDIRPEVQSADVVIAPLRIGGGTRLKILEAMAMGRAVVSTSIGAEGLDVVAERDILIADDAEAFSAQICRVLTDRDLARRLGIAARRLVEARYGWAASVARLSEFYREILGAHGAA